MIFSEIRPNKIEKMYGSHMDPLREDIEKGEIARAYLFYGPSGTGKTTAGLMLENYLPKVKVKEISVAGSSTKKDAEKLLKSIATIPIGFETKLVIFNEMHKASPGFESAILDFIEFPPKGVYIVITTTEIQKVLRDIRGRCKKLEFKPLNLLEITEVLEDGREACIETSPLSKAVISIIYKKSEGCARDALTELELLDNITDEKEMLKRLSVLTEDVKLKVYDLYDSLYRAKPWSETVKLINLVNHDKTEGIRLTLLNMASNMATTGRATSDADLRIVHDIMHIFSQKIYVDHKDLVQGCLEYYYGD